MTIGQTHQGFLYTSVLCTSVVDHLITKAEVSILTGARLLVSTLSLILDLEQTRTFYLFIYYNNFILIMTYNILLLKKGCRREELNLHRKSYPRTSISIQHHRAQNVPYWFFINGYVLLWCCSWLKTLLQQKGVLFISWFFKSSLLPTSWLFLLVPPLLTALFFCAWHK